MTANRFVGRIKLYTVASFIVPIIAINTCLLIYKFMGNLTTDFHIYPNYNWSIEKVEYSYKEYISIKNNHDEYTYTNCPENGYDLYFVTTDNEKIIAKSENSDLINGLIESDKIKSVSRESSSTALSECVKNNKSLYYFLKKFNLVEKILVKSTQNNKSGFSKIKNPYFYGEASISRTARYSPAVYVFKPLIVSTAILLLLYWTSILNFFNDLKSKNNLNSFSKKFFYLGVFSCIFLILHAIFLGVDFDSKLFQRIRKVIIILFIIFEMCAQIFLTHTLFKLKEKLKNYINPLILKMKIIFVVFAFSLTIVAFVILIFYDPSTSFKHILEWNYFTLLLFYYLLSRLLFR